MEAVSRRLSARKPRQVFRQMEARHLKGLLRSGINKTERNYARPHP